MNVQELQETLSHYSYRRFWGIRHSSAPLESNLWTNVTAIKNSPALLQKLEMQHRRLSGFHPIRLFVYRLFNIDNCNAHYYQLCAFHAAKRISHIVPEEDTMQRIQSLLADARGSD
jgi:hypothetical protein